MLLGALVGLRAGEACGLRVIEVDFMRGIVTPAEQHQGEALKTDGSGMPVPVPRELALQLAAFVQQYGSRWVVTDGAGGQCPSWRLERAIRSAKREVKELPKEFSFHDFRHYFASLLIADGADIKTVQARLRHDSAVTTLRVYGHLWPDTDESTRATVAKVLAARADSAAKTLAD